MSEWIRVTTSVAAKDAKHDGHRSSLSILVIAATEFAADGAAASAATLDDLATVLRRTVRRVDIIRRIAADRFALEVQGAPSTGVLRLAQRLQNAVAAHRKSGAELPASIAIGIARQLDSSVTVPELLHRADAAATEAMADRGNAIRLYELAMPGSDSRGAQGVSDRVLTQLRLIAGKSGGAKTGRGDSHLVTSMAPEPERAPASAASVR